jgi:hypothetical protein
VKARHVVVGAAALVALAGCSGHHSGPQVTVSPAAQNAYLEQLKAIDPGLAAKPDVAVAKGETICVDIAKNLRWNQIQADAEKTFAVDANEAEQLMAMTQKALCGTS